MISVDDLSVHDLSVHGLSDLSDVWRFLLMVTDVRPTSSTLEPTALNGNKSTVGE